METLVITPKEVNNQYIIDIPDFLRDNKYDLKIVVHYFPKNENRTDESLPITKDNEIDKKLKYKHFIEAAGNIILDENELYDFRKISTI